MPWGVARSGFINQWTQIPADSKAQIPADLRASLPAPSAARQAGAQPSAVIGVLKNSGETKSRPMSWNHMYSAPGFGPVRAQSMIETALLLGAVVIALITFFTFIRSAVSSRIKIGSDAFGHGLLHNGK